MDAGGKLIGMETSVISPWSTVGEVKFKGKRIPARVLTGGDGGLWNDALADESRFKLVIVASGNTVLEADGRQCAVISPAAVFLPHRHAIRLPLPSGAAEDKLILFHPCYIFDTLGFEDRAVPPRDDPAAFQDGYLLPRFFAATPLAERVIILEPGQARHIMTAADRMKAQLEGQPDSYWPCRARSYLLEILIACTRLAEAGARQGISMDGLSPELAPIFSFLVSHIGEKLTVDRIAREFSTNRTSLQEKVRRITGLPVTQYVIRLRVQTAAVLLRNTSLTIAEIMERTGFNDESHFSRSFKKYADRPPAEYREAFVVPSYVK